MGVIRVLPDDLVSKIAAGEVVERPSSVVKELVENAIDARSEDVLIEVRNGGKDFIQVTDDGEGMSGADAALALQRYATSKIRDIQDLSSILTFGFRGEALPSIASCSRFELATKPRDTLSGYLLRGEAGRVNEETETGMADGTRVTVRDLFFNLPARRKFLRSAETEFSHTFDEVLNFSLAFPAIRLRLIHNQKTVLSLDAAPDRESRLRALFGHNFPRTSVRIDYESSPVSVSGWLGHSESYTRQDTLFFVNDRRVRNRNLLHALYEAYRRYSKERDQLVIAFIDIVPTLVDVNIHPRKSEVRFANERSIHDILFRSVVEALERGSLGASLRPEPGTDLEEIRTLDNLPQLHNTYILVETQQGIVLVDQHAAHERVLIEHMEKQYLTMPAQRVLFPVTLELPPRLHDTLVRYRELIRQFGFGVEHFGGRTHILSSVPSLCVSHDPQAFLVEILEELSNLAKVHDPRRRLLEVIACKAAVKAGAVLTDGEKKKLIQDLYSCKEPDHCPHGRPTMLKLTLQELARRFGRS